ncbi:M15 family metallopeptidase [Streptomyces sp. NPDC057939]|uniref:M15 family metallopeptidase n=1 Tax=Streptomyces sp. NPDC057939 TaxID=3346284 RepID=UPI0036EF2BBC
MRWVAAVRVVAAVLVARAVLVVPADAIGAVHAAGAAGPGGTVHAAGASGPVGAVHAAGASGASGSVARLAGFVALRDIDPSVVEDIRYAGARNFTGAVVDGYEEPVCLLARPAAEALRRAQRELLRSGYSLKVFDCYRPQRAVDRFVRWAGDAADQSTKAEFHPGVDKSRLIPEGYIAARSGHSRGSTVDVTVVRLPARRELDMGTAFDFFDSLSHTDDPRVSGTVRENRGMLKGVLGAQGFVNLPEEWWHFTYRPEPHPDTYFDFPVAVATVRP